MQHCNLLSQTFTYFVSFLFFYFSINNLNTKQFPTIVSSLGYGKTATLLLTAPPWFAAFLASLAVTWHAGKTNDRSLHIAASMMLVVVGNIVVCLSLTRTSKIKLKVRADDHNKCSRAQILRNGMNFPSPVSSYHVSTSFLFSSFLLAVLSPPSKLS